jgi:hypothetical protein
MDKALRNTIIVGIIIVALSVAYYFVVFLPSTKREKNIESSISQSQIAEKEKSQEAVDDEVEIIDADYGHSFKVGDYEIIIDDIKSETGEEAQNISAFIYKGEYYKNTLKIAIPHFKIKNWNQSKTLRFEPADFSLLSPSGFRFKHISPGKPLGNTLIGGEIRPGYEAEGWYGFEIPRGYKEGYDMTIEMLFPDIPQIVRLSIKIP